MSTSHLFTPFTLNRLALPNRWVMPAMQRGMCERGRPSAELAAYYRRRAERRADQPAGTISGVVAPAVKPIFS